MTGEDSSGETHEKTGGGRRGSRMGAAASVEVTRGLNDTRLAVLGILLGIAVTAALGVPDIPAIWRFTLGVLVFLGLATFLHVVLSSHRLTHYVMRFAHWTLGRHG